VGEEGEEGDEGPQVSPRWRFPFNNNYNS
jgi:hypothetical protein